MAKRKTTVKATEPGDIGHEMLIFWHHDGFYAIADDPEELAGNWSEAFTDEGLEVMRVPFKPNAIATRTPEQRIPAKVDFTAIRGKR